MSTIDRRALVRTILFGGAAAGLALAPGATQAAMPFDELVPCGQNDLIEKAQVVVVNPGWRRPRRRVWRCWWHRGRRVCGWRWV